MKTNYINYIIWWTLFFLSKMYEKRKNKKKQIQNEKLIDEIQ